MEREQQIQRATQAETIRDTYITKSSSLFTTIPFARLIDVRVAFVGVLHEVRTIEGISIVVTLGSHICIPSSPASPPVVRFDEDGRSFFGVDPLTR